MKKEFKKGGVLTRKGYRKNKKKEEIKKTIKILFIGFILGILYSYLFLYQDLIKSTQRAETVALVQLDQKEENNAQEPKKTEITTNYECSLDEISCKIKKYADNYGLDYKLAIAISKHETGSYTSIAFKEKNNVGGMMYWNGSKSVLKSFNTLDEGIEAFVKNLKINYIDMGLDTIELIQTKYCPIGVNDNGLNKFWVSGVKRYYEELN